MRVRTSWATPLVVLLLAATFMLTQDSFYRIQLGTLAGIYAIAAIGLTLLFGGAGQISLGHAGILGVSAFMTAYLSVTRGLSPWIAGVLGVTVATVIGLLLGWSALRTSGHYLALVTLAFGLMFVEFGKTIFPDGWYGVPPLELGPLTTANPTTMFAMVWALTVALLVAASLLIRSRFGRSLEALRDDPVAAASSGIDLARTKVAVFGIASALGGLSGWLFAIYQGSVTETSFGFMLSFNLLIMVVIGGLGSPAGAVAGTVFLVLVPELGRSYEQYRLLGYGLVLILVLAALPGGLASIGRLAKSTFRSKSKQRDAEVAAR